MEHAFHEEDMMVRYTGDTIALTPPLVISESQIGEIADKLARTINAVA
jgi:beta-alanine--pyruvate transaminase